MAVDSRSLLHFTKLGTRYLECRHGQSAADTIGKTQLSCKITVITVWHTHGGQLRRVLFRILPFPLCCLCCSLCLLLLLLFQCFIYQPLQLLLLSQQLQEVEQEWDVVVFAAN